VKEMKVCSPTNRKKELQRNCLKLLRGRIFKEFGGCRLPEDKQQKF
jgi:hypothetical protein